MREMERRREGRRDGCVPGWRINTISNFFPLEYTADIRDYSFEPSFRSGCARVEKDFCFVLPRDDITNKVTHPQLRV